MKHSIRLRLALTLAALIMGTIFMCWSANKFFLGKFYEVSKIETLGNAYEEINRAYNNNISNENLVYSGEENEVDLAIEKMSSNRNMSVYVFDLPIIQYKGMQMALPKVIYPSRITEDRLEQLSNIVSRYLNMDTNKADMRLLESSDRGYDIYKVYDARLSSSFIELFGQLDDGSRVYIRTNFESIMESVEISNRFLGYMGIAATLVGMLIMLIISNRFTRPILELSDIARRMSDLDFNVKYQIDRQDEIGVLGTSINSLSEKLEKTVSELKTANNELQKDIENKIQIDEMRKEFLSNVSHELKTPIALVQGYAEGLKENINDEEGSREFYCEVIIDEANKMNKMVKKLLTLNQIESGNEQAAIERFDIAALIRAVLVSVEILVQQKQVTVIFPESEPMYVWADEYRMEEVITNYISNALNHVEERDGKRIEIRIHRGEERVRVSVFNTGNQIPEEDLEKIWIKFYKVDKARTREYGGNGIGLSIVKAIMTSLNQDCGAINHENGVEFWFELDTKI